MTTADICEVCGAPSCITLQRRIQHDKYSEPDPSAPLHPRCSRHLAPGDATVIDAQADAATE